MSIWKAFLKVAIVCVGVSALMAIVCLLRGTWGDLEGQCVFTSLIVAAGSILSMGCGAAWETRRNPLLAVAGFVATGFATTVSLLILWDALADTTPWLKALAVGWIVAAACAHASLLSLARLEGPGLWVGIVAQVSIMTLTARLIQLVLTEGDIWFHWRALGINAIVVAATSVMVPILHVMARAASEPSEAAAYLTCPRCGHSHRGAPGAQTCRQCGQNFRVELE